jgi:spore germination protein YaaH
VVNGVLFCDVQISSMAAYGSLENHQYTMGPHDTIETIAESLGVSVYDIERVNPGVNVHCLKCGDMFYIPCDSYIPPEGAHGTAPQQCYDCDHHDTYTPPSTTYTPPTTTTYTPPTTTYMPPTSTYTPPASMY